MALAYLNPNGGSMLAGLGALALALVVLGVLNVLAVWIVRRVRSRPCPRCGHRVKTGVLMCHSCGFDFSILGATSSLQGHQ